MSDYNALVSLHFNTCLMTVHSGPVKQNEYQVLLHDIEDVSVNILGSIPCE